ncbi:Tyrosine transaminase family protein [Theobroma cacao]|uniref:Tyrosine transaminase family protein n=1 Tax=Theobroma cacao TaxID=3641 RepID=A0A061E4D4_THECC|nr:Tyrosine transaminase family protein [Theobroma cacao]
MIPNAFLTTHMVGDGSSIRFWSNPWVGEVTLSKLFPKMFALTQNEERFPAMGAGLRENKTSKQVEEWRTLPCGIMKFNVVKQGWGVMRNKDGCVKIVLSKSIGVEDSSVAEIKAIESNSQNTVKWTNYSLEAPWRLKKCVLHTERLKKKIKRWEIKHIFRIAEQIKACLNIGSDPVTFIQGALPQNLEKTNKDFFSKYINILKQTSDILCDRIKEIPCITCPQKPKGSVFIMVKLDLSLLEGIDDDMDFCVKLAMGESVSILPVEED